MRFATFESYKQLICEHFVTLFHNNQKEKEEYIDEVWDMLQQAYKPIGGFKTADTKEELMYKADIWKLVRRNGKITACKLYTSKKGGGRKSIAGASTTDGKQDLFKIVEEDVKMVDREVWAEVSSAMEYLMTKYGAKYIPIEIVEKILKGKELNHNGDDYHANSKDCERIPYKPGYHYIRNIGGKPYRKGMVGNLPKSITDRI